MCLEINMAMMAIRYFLYQDIGSFAALFCQKAFRDCYYRVFPPGRANADKMSPASAAPKGIISRSLMG
jgi:hypothetical protein